MSTTEQYDLAVIGSGPGGYVCAIRASQLGLKVALIEKNDLGGVCTNWGCIPTKTLLESAHFFARMKNDKLGIIFDTPPKPNIEKIVERSRQVVKKLTAGISSLLKKYNVTLLTYRAELASSDQINLFNNDGVLEKTIDAKNICLATGAKAKKVGSIEYGRRVITFKEALLLKEIPAKILIVGAGAIGCEFADYFQCLGSKVTLLEALETILPAEEPFLGNELKAAFERKGMRVLTSTKMLEVKQGENEVKVSLQNSSQQNSSQPASQSIEDSFDYVLMAIGITPNLEGLGLENLSIQIQNNLLPVNEFNLINGTQNVYAIGDIVRGKQLAHKASHEGIMVAEHLAGHKVKPFANADIPSCTYTHPQVASVGFSAKELDTQNLKYKKGVFPYSALGRALAADSIRGFFTVYVGEETGEILGAHCIGENVTDIISHFVIARQGELVKEDFMQAIFPHPTFAEGVHEAIAVAFGESCNY